MALCTLAAHRLHIQVMSQIRTLSNFGRLGLQQLQHVQKAHTMTVSIPQGDLNNVSATRFVEPPVLDPDFAYRSLAISAEDDDPEVRSRYRPFLLPPEFQRTDWVNRLELATVTKMAYEDFQKTWSRPKILVLYGSLRQR